MSETIEIFFNKELADISFDIDALDEWTETCESLGMTKQLNLKSGKENSPVPYPFMNVSMTRVFENLCGAKVEFRQYSKTPIPLDVLKQIAFSVKEKHFSKIEVWYDDKGTDPLVVGFTGKWGFYNDLYDADGNKMYFATSDEAIQYSKSLDKNNNNPYFYAEDSYLVARWGDEKMNFDILKERAKNRFVEEHTSRMKKDLVEIQQKISLINENSSLYLSGDLSLSEATNR